MKKILLIGILVLSGFASAGDSVPAVWRTHHFYLPARTVNDCMSARRAIDEVAYAVRAENVEFRCVLRSGAEASFESLVEVDPGKGDTTGMWETVQLQMSTQGPGCSDFADAFDMVLDQVGVQNVRSTVFCDYGWGSISYQFDALVPTE